MLSDREKMRSNAPAVTEAPPIAAVPQYSAPAPAPVIEPAPEPVDDGPVSARDKELV